MFFLNIDRKKVRARRSEINKKVFFVKIEKKRRKENEIGGTEKVILFYMMKSTKKDEAELNLVRKEEGKMKGDLID